MSGAVRRYLLLGAIVVIVLAVAFVFRDRLTSSPVDLQVGDCFNLDNPAADTVDTIPHSPCAEAHHYEVIFLATDPSASGAAYPALSVFDNDVTSQCEPAFLAYVGVPIDNSSLQMGYFYPQADGWSNGRRTITCYVNLADNGVLTSTVKGSKK